MSAHPYSRGISTDGMRCGVAFDRTCLSAKTRHRGQPPRQQTATVSCCIASRTPCDAATSDGLRALREHRALLLVSRHAVRLQSACRATGFEFDVEEAEELEGRDDQNGAGYQVSDELLSMMAPETVPTPIFDNDEVVALLEAVVHDKARQHYRAFFSSVLGGITTNPALMTVHIDDHMVHRGHAVFDSAKLIDGHIYQLGGHVDRFLYSAGKAGIQLPMSNEQMVRTILETAAASSAANGYVRFWLSAGRGGFGLSSAECESPAFYCIAYSDDGTRPDIRKGWTVKTSPVPQKDEYFATLKSTNYLVNALAVLDAQVEDIDQGIFLDPDGNVAEGPNMNLGIVTQDDQVVTPPYMHALHGITMSRIIELIPENMERGLLDEVVSMDQRHISLAEAKAAKEVFLTSTSLPVQGITHWDGEPIGDGSVGPVTVKLNAMLERDATPSDAPPDDESFRHLPVPYGYVTQMDDPEGEDEEDD